MGSRKIRFLCITAMVFFVSMMGAHGGRLGRKGFFSGLINSMPATRPKLDESKLAQIWFNCIYNSMESVGVLRSSSSLLDDLVQNPIKTSLLPECRMISVMNSPASAVKHIFLRCLMSKGFNHLSRNTYGLRNIHSECWGHPVLRRRLAHLILHNTAPAFASGDVLAFTSTPFQALKVEPSGPTPAPFSDIAPIRSSSDGRLFPPSSIDLCPTNTDTNKPDCVPTSAKEENSPERTSAVSSMSTTSGTFFLVACMFCCYRRCPREKNHLTYVKNERPLMNLEFSNFLGLARKCFGTWSSIQKGLLSLITSRNENKRIQSLNAGSDGTSLSNILSGYPNPMNAREPRALPLPQPSCVVPCPILVPPPCIVLSPASYATPTPPPSLSSLTCFPEPIPAVASSPHPPPPPPLPSPPAASMLPSTYKTLPSLSLPPLPSINSGPKPPPPPPLKVAVGHPSQGGSSSRVQRTALLEPNNSGTFGTEAYNGVTKTKLKPFFWDKVLGNADQSIVWQKIRSGSFRFDEKMIEKLFGYNSTRKSNEVVKELSPNDTSTRCIHLLDHKKSQNLSISLKALNVKTEEVCDALVEGNELPVELLQTLLRIQPTTDEELKLRLYSGDLSLLGPAEQFLKALVDIPFAFKRIDALLFMSSLHEDVSRIKDAFATLEEACIELRSKRLFLKLLEAVLKTGNRMNDGTFRGGAQAFKLDTLLKLSDVKGSDGKTTLLHFVVQEIIRSEGQRAVRLARQNKSLPGLVNFNSDEFSIDSPMEDERYYRNLGLEIVSGLSSELQNVKKAAGMDMDGLTTMAAGFSHKLLKTEEFLKKDMKILGEDSGFSHLFKYFVEHAQDAVTLLKKEENRISLLLHKTTDSFHGNAGKDEGLRLFIIVRDFLGMLDKACKEVREAQNKVSHALKFSSNSNTPNSPDPRQPLFPTVSEKQVDNFDSDEE